jgi:tRNA A-37 threonylcarbamoyl transferase component Bud32
MSCKESEEAKEDFDNDKCEPFELDLITNGDEDTEYFLYIYRSNARGNKSASVTTLNLLVNKDNKFWEPKNHPMFSKASNDEDKPLRRASDFHGLAKLNFINEVKASLKIGKSLNGGNRRFRLPERIENVIEQRLIETGMNEFSDRDNRFEAKYELFEILGEGTTGVVKKCINKITRQPYAVKIVRTNDTEIIKTIKNEFLIQKELSHPNIVRVYELFYNPVLSQINIVMELVDGVELFDDVIENGAFEGNDALLFIEKDARKIFAGVLSSIQYMHSKGVCHRDIKPQNILFSFNKDENCVNVTDFNASRYFKRDEEVVKMITNTGTFEYRAPEMLLQQEYT